MVYSLRLRSVTEEYSGLPWSWIIPCMVFGIVTVLVPMMVIVLLNVLFVRIICIFVIILALLYFKNNMRSPTVLSATGLKLRYRIRAYKGEHIIPKHTVPLQFLKGIVPLEKVHPNGLIEFTNKRYGIMYMLFVPRRTGKELEIFIELITKNIVNRIHDGQVLKVFEMQRYTTDVTIKNQVVAAMNDESKTPEQRAHLNSIHKQLIANTDIPTKREILAFIALGRFEDIRDAEAERDNLAPSIEDGLKLAGVRYNMLIVPDSIGMVYRRCIK